MKTNHFILLFLLLCIGCSDNFNEENLSPEKKIEKRSPCKPNYKNLACNDNTINALVGPGFLEVEVDPLGPLLLSGYGTSGILDNILNCQGYDTDVFVCERECTETGLLSLYGSGTIGNYYTLCDEPIVDQFTAEEQEQVVDNILYYATVNAPSCNGEPMTPVTFDVVIDDSIAGLAFFDVFVTWVSECDNSVYIDLIP